MSIRMKIMGAGLVLLSACAQLLQAAPVRPEERIAQLEQAVNDAYAANDLPKYFGFYADDLVAIFYSERTTLAKYRASWTKSVQAGNVVLAVKLTDMVVRLSPAGDVAVASYHLDVRNRASDGKETEEHAFETDVWTKRRGAWQITYVHYALSSPPGV
jgi:ketosteroid isomerase-like protein